MKRISRRALLQLSIAGSLGVAASKRSAAAGDTSSRRSTTGGTVPAFHPDDGLQNDKARLLRLAGELGGIKARCRHV